MTFLLDVNVLIGLLDTEHDFHDQAHAWFEQVGSADWATCAITENAVLRILGARNYLNTPGPPHRVAELLAGLLSVGRHTFWTDDVRLMTSPAINRADLTRSGQITDIHLLALAVWHGGRLATFDRRIVPDPVEGGTAALHFIPKAH